MKPRFFSTTDAFRAWLAAHHETDTELWVAFYRKGSGKEGLTYPQGVDAALCFGWIDGHKKRVDETSFTHRFTPRRAGSIWSAINVRRALALERDGHMAPAGRAAFAARQASRTGVYTYENAVARLSPAYVTLWKKNRASWAFFHAQPPGYQKLVKGWIMRAKQDATRRRRLETVIRASSAGKRVR
jgi:uncharacterized protein YdeI (YjbR/CyaY-like superfamily)